MDAPKDKTIALKFINHQKIDNVINNIKSTYKNRKEHRYPNYKKLQFQDAPYPKILI